MLRLFLNFFRIFKRIFHFILSCFFHLLVDTGNTRIKLFLMRIGVVRVCNFFKLQ